MENVKIKFDLCKHYCIALDNGLTFDQLADLSDIIASIDKLEAILDEEDDTSNIILATQSYIAHISYQIGSFNLNDDLDMVKIMILDRLKEINCEILNNLQ